MKVLALRTYTDCFNKVDSLRCLGHEVTEEQYDDRPHDRQGEIVDLARRVEPDFVVFIGALEPYHTKPVLTPDILCRLRDVAPLVHICNDAADDPWWPMLEEYDRRGCFTVQVSIDGSHNNPIAGFSNGLLALTPTDYRPFAPKLWDERSVRCGFVGGLGHSFRAATINALRSSGHLDFREGPGGRSYDEFACLLCNIQVMPNFAHTGTARFMHVKGRVVEAGLAGCCVLEQMGAPTDRWFEPGVDYLEYADAHDIAAFLERDDLPKIAESFHRRVVAEHHPKVFWDKVLSKAGAV